MKDVTTGTEQSFDKQTSGESSSSKYIQANTAPVNGNNSVVNKITGTPDDVIIKPNLKTATCETKSLEIPLLQKIIGKLTGAVPSFSKKKQAKEIKEPAPTGEKAQYGMIRVAQTKGGFVDITDETPGNKRKIHLHPTGTYDAVLDNGDMHEKIVHDRFIIIDKNWNISVGEDMIEVITGNNKIQIKKDRQTNINGNDHLNVDGNSNTNIVGDLGLQVGGDNIEHIDGDMVSEIIGNLTESIKKDHKHTVNGAEVNTVMKDRTDLVMGSLTVVVSGDTVVHVGGNANVSVDGKAHVLAKGGVDIDGGSEIMSGSVTKKCVCPLVHGDHIDASSNVRESK